MTYRSLSPVLAFSEKPRPGASSAPFATGSTAIIPKFAPSTFFDET